MDGLRAKRMTYHAQDIHSLPPRRNKPMNAATEGKKGYRRLIPSLTALVEFEAVARLGSFTKAADELGVTQAAASRQVRLLEDTLGVRLFHRLHRSIQLTAEGETLYVVVAEALQKVSGVFDRLGSGDDGPELVLATTAAFSRFRLLPRLALLRQRQPHLKLRLTTQMFTAELRHSELDVAVRFGNGKWRDGSATLLFGEEVFPVCSPGWLKANQAPQSLAELEKAPLIESDSTSEGWMGWETWFQGAGVQKPKLRFALRCSLYTDAVEAALHGEGVALGWGRLLEDLLKSGVLLRLTSASVKVSDAYYAVVPHGRSVTPAMAGLIDWLRDGPVD